MLISEFVALCILIPFFEFGIAVVCFFVCWLVYECLRTHFTATKPKSKEYIFRAFRVEITINYRTGVTEWTNWVGHPLLDYETRVGPFKVMKAAGQLTTLNTWSTDQYIQLSCQPGETSRENIKKAAMKIHKWNRMITVKGSKQQKLITELIGDSGKEDEIRFKEPTACEGLWLIGHQTANTADEYLLK